MHGATPALLIQAPVYTHERPAPDIRQSPRLRHDLNFARQSDQCCRDNQPGTPTCRQGQTCPLAAPPHAINRILASFSDPVLGVTECG